MGITTVDITGVILAGGRGSRMGGVDKGLAPLAGRPMVSYVIDALRPQVGALLINANRSEDEYAAFGLQVIRDPLEGFAGPLAGMAAALAAARTPYVVTAPCDSPLLPNNLVPRLGEALSAARAQISVAHDGERMHPVFALMDRGLLDSLRAYLTSGERKIDRWFARHDLAVCDFSDEADCFLNVNDAGERRALESRLRATERE
jgi:molybdopterin-guanine dinucleotide biosynthesis protein A